MKQRIREMKLEDSVVTSHDTKISIENLHIETTKDIDITPEIMETALRGFVVIFDTLLEEGDPDKENKAYIAKLLSRTIK